MGKSLPSSACKFREVTKAVSSSSSSYIPKYPTPKNPSPPPRTVVSFGKSRVDPHQTIKLQKMEEPSFDPDGRTRVPLARVVSECVKRWFQDTLKQAKAGDTAMQVLVGQMYSSGYGVPKDPHKGCTWINRASSSRSSVWKVSDKRPGYNASDSDSEEQQDETK